MIPGRLWNPQQLRLSIKWSLVPGDFIALPFTFLGIDVEVASQWFPQDYFINFPFALNLGYTRSLPSNNPKPHVPSEPLQGQVVHPWNLTLVVTKHHWNFTWLLISQDFDNFTWVFPKITKIIHKNMYEFWEIMSKDKYLSFSKESYSHSCFSKT